MYMAKICFFLCIICLPLSLFSCRLEPFSSEETFSLQLPQWPPSYDRQKYPELAYWIVETSSGSFKTTEPALDFTVEKGMPFYALAYAVTKTESGENVQFFMPAGFVYPFCQYELTWENGFGAKVMEQIWQGSEGKSKREKLQFLLKFNWKRFFELVQTKIDQSLERADEEVGCYNPWQLSISSIAELISSRKFYATALNLSVTSYQTLHFNNEMERQMLSSFIPENSVIYDKGIFCLSPEKINLFSIYNAFGVIIYGGNSEKNSPKLINLPIIKE